MGDEMINNPIHYGGKENVYETIKVIDNWELDFLLGNVIKYISRAGKKDPTKKLEDLKKALFYLERKIKNLENEN
jgi:hypothetical protein|tara:strand:+ start:1214 stop:1438 length:225 start_codon:yes stop_codon:yes gene_type:complete